MSLPVLQLGETPLHLGALRMGSYSASPASPSGNSSRDGVGNRVIGDLVGNRVIDDVVGNRVIGDLVGNRVIDAFVGLEVGYSE